MPRKDLQRRGAGRLPSPRLDAGSSTRDAFDGMPGQMEGADGAKRTLRSCFSSTLSTLFSSSPFSCNVE